jgi:hypothetical protein
MKILTDLSYFHPKMRFVQRINTNVNALFLAYWQAGHWESAYSLQLNCRSESHIHKWTLISIIWMWWSGISFGWFATDYFMSIVRSQITGNIIHN